MHAILIAAIHEANAIIDRFIAADSSAPAFAAVIKMLLGKILAAAEALAPDRQELEEFRAKAEATRVRNAACQARRRAGSPASPTRHGDEKCHGDTAPSRARSSSILEEGKIDDDDDPRARISKKTAEEVAKEAEQIVQSNGKWPKLPSIGWNHSSVVAQIEQRLKQGIQPQLIIDAVLMATPRATNFIHSFAFFNRPGGPIESAHWEATAQRSLPLMRAIEGGKVAPGKGASHVNDYAKRRIAEAKQAEASDEVGSAGSDPPADLPMDPAQTG
jgi:hypothetical protein